MQADGGAERENFRRSYLWRFWRRSACVALVGAVLHAAHADAVDAINSVRRAGCDGRPGVKEPVRRSAALDRVARRWASGDSLQQALAGADYRSRRSIATRLPGELQDAGIAARLRATYCEMLTDPQVRHAGLASRGDAVWLVLAAPHQLPARASADRVADEVLELVNQARRSVRSCGTERFAAAPPLSASETLARAAQAHAADMAKNDFLAHRGSDGSQVGQRAQRAGYAWRMVGENVAGGPSSAREVVDGWLASPGHCRNIMEPQYTQMGVGFATADDTRLLIYWAQVFGRPR